MCFGVATVLQPIKSGAGMRPGINTGQQISVATGSKQINMPAVNFCRKILILDFGIKKARVFEFEDSLFLGIF